MRSALAFAALAALPAWAGAETCPDLTALQRVAGFVTWQNTLRLGAIGLGAAGALFFCSGLVRRFLRQTGLIELLLWALAAGGLAGGALVPAELRVWPVLIGSLVLPGAAAFSLWRRQIRLPVPRILMALAFAWGAIAWVAGLPAVGFLAVGALLAWLGLRIAVGPFCYAFGFDGPDALMRATVAGAALVTGFTALVATGVPLGPLSVFRPGALWLGSFAWFLGVLIVSVRWYRPGHYARRQFLAMASLGAALSAGLLLGASELVTMAATFWLFYVLGKVAEIPLAGRIGFGLKLIGAAGLLAGIWWGSHQVPGLPALLAGAV